VKEMVTFSKVVLLTVTSILGTLIQGGMQFAQGIPQIGVPK